MTVRPSTARFALRSFIHLLLSGARGCARSRRTHAPGFSLIEVLFALAVVGLALGAAATVFRAGLTGSATAGDVDEALRLADAKLDEAGADTPLRPGVSAGASGRFQWRLAIAPADDAEAASSNLALFRIEARISWRDGPRQRQVALDTLRLGTAVPP